MRVLIGNDTGQLQASVIHAWNRGDIPAGNESVGASPKIHAMAQDFFSASPNVAKILYLWTGRHLMFLGADHHGRYFDIRGTPVQVQQLEASS